MHGKVIHFYVAEPPNIILEGSSNYKGPSKSQNGLATLGYHLSTYHIISVSLW